MIKVIKLGCESDIVIGRAVDKPAAIRLMERDMLRKIVEAKQFYDFDMCSRNKFLMIAHYDDGFVYPSLVCYKFEEV